MRLRHLSASAREKKYAAASFIDRAVIGCRPSVASQPELGLSSQRSTGRRSVSGHRAGVDGSSVEAVLATHRVSAVRTWFLKSSISASLGF